MTAAPAAQRSRNASSTLDLVVRIGGWWAHRRRPTGSCANRPAMAAQRCATGRRWPSARAAQPSTPRRASAASTMRVLAEAGSRSRPMCGWRPSSAAWISKAAGSPRGPAAGSRACRAISPAARRACRARRAPTRPAAAGRSPGQSAGRLPLTMRPRMSDEFARLQRQVELVEQHAAARGDAQFLGCEQRCRHQRRPADLARSGRTDQRLRRASGVSWLVRAGARPAIISGWSLRVARLRAAARRSRPDRAARRCPGRCSVTPRVCSSSCAVTIAFCPGLRARREQLHDAGQATLQPQANAAAPPPAPGRGRAGTARRAARARAMPSTTCERSWRNRRLQTMRPTRPASAKPTPGGAITSGADRRRGIQSVSTRCRNDAPGAAMKSATGHSRPVEPLDEGHSVTALPSALIGKAPTRRVYSQLVVRSLVQPGAAGHDHENRDQIAMRIIRASSA